MYVCFDRLCANWCNKWCIVLNLLWSWYVDQLVWNPSWFRLTIGIIWVQVWKLDCFRWSFRHLSSYNLVSSVIADIRAGLVLNTSIVYLKQNNFQRKPKTLCKVCKWSYPLCPYKDFRWLSKYWLGGLNYASMAMLRYGYVMTALCYLVVKW